MSGNGYEPRFDLDFRRGAEGEAFVRRIMRLTAGPLIEVKRDAKAMLTGNLYVELYCLRGGVWRESGLLTTEATMWSFVLMPDGMALFVETNVLGHAAAELWHDERNRREQPEGSHPTRGVIVSIAWLVKNLSRLRAQVPA